MPEPESNEIQRLIRAQKNLELLQAQVDSLHAENSGLRRRVEHLHEDRESLRKKAHTLEAGLRAMRNRGLYRLRSLAADLVRRRATPRDVVSRIRSGSPVIPPLADSAPAFREGPTATHSDLIPAISFSEPRPKRDLRVAAIMDDFSRAAFSPEFDYIAISPEGWRSELSDPPDLLLVESAFGGNKGKWVNEIAGFCPPRETLSDLTAWCREHGVPTVFWNKEDPANFEWFIGAASAFDWVFTVDFQSIPRYRSELGHNRIAPLPFAAQPAIHFPPELETDRSRDVAFAGSYYANKHSERRRQMEMILEPALEFGLDIFDRMGSLGDPRFTWPELYQTHLRGSLSYAQTTEAYRRYKVFLNVNTVTDSPTMCARRVFELLASGTPVISGPAAALDEMVPKDAILISHSRQETANHLSELLTTPEARRTMGASGRHWINSGNTYSDRVEELLGLINLA